MTASRTFLILSSILLLFRTSVAATDQPVFYSCTTSAYAALGSGLAGHTTAAGCADGCYAAGGYKYSSFLASSGHCTCTNTNAVAATMVSDDPGDCGTSFESMVTDTSFTLGTSCTTKPSGTVLASGSSTDLMTIFETCAKDAYAIITPSGSTYDYTCQNAVSGGTAETCSDTDTRVYSHPAAAQASGLSRRRRAETRVLAAQGRSNAQHCPTGLSPCLIGNDEQGGYECIDTSSELESCGGCLYGVLGRTNATSPAEGVDCSAISGVALGGSTCVFGQCHFSCRTGFSMVNRVCVRGDEQTSWSLKKALGRYSA